jgi:hypothetical protein
VPTPLDAPADDARVDTSDIWLADLQHLKERGGVPANLVKTDV